MTCNASTSKCAENPVSASEPRDCVIEELIKKPFRLLSYQEKKEVISKGRPTPTLPNLIQFRKTGGKTVKLSFYTAKYTEIPWLSGCKHLNKLFCWPCLLFCNQKCVWNNEGVSDLNNLGNILRKRHQQTKEHIGASVSLKEFEKSETRIEFCLSKAYKADVEKHNATVKSNRECLKSLIDATCYLALQELPFRGHDESESSLNRGNYTNYRELLYFMAEKDPHLESQLNSSSVFSDQASMLQNDLIEACAEHLMLKIKQEILTAQFISFIMDETTDISKKCQLCVVFRYVDLKGEIQERFIRFIDVVSDDRTADKISKILLQHLEEFYSGDKLIGQAYDGAAVNTGQYHGLAAKVKPKYPQALFTICYSHELNLVLQDSVKSIKSCKVFLMTVSGFAYFFSNSSKQNHALNEIVNAHFPSVAPTRWLYNSRPIEMIYDHKQQLIQLFDHIVANNTEFDPETRFYAISFRKNLFDFEFNFILEIFHLVLPEAEILFKFIHKKTSDIVFCLGKVKEFKEFLLRLRCEFHVLWSKINHISASDSNSIKEHSSKRQQLDIVRHDRETTFRRLYYEILDNFIAHVEERFTDLHQLKFFALLDFSKFEEYSCSFPKSYLQSLIKSPYGHFFDGAGLNSELSYVYSSPSFKLQSVSELNDCLVENDLSETFPQLSTLIKLIMTIPASSATAERDFSTLKRIKTYCRNSTAQDRLNGLSLISIEKTLFRKLKSHHSFHDAVIDIFATKEDRRIELKYK